MGTSVLKISVVIPFYQRDRGLLARAVRSAFDQRNVSDLCVIVVDDGSPISARNELAEIETRNGRDLHIIKVGNGGVGRARNIGLDEVPPDTHYVAFLDSDDEWAPEHLSVAIRALETGADLYFADHIRDDWDTSAFTRCATFHPEEHIVIDRNNDTYQFVGSAFDQVLRNNMIGTSVLVYRYAPFASFRFGEDMLSSGEDVLFWLAILRKTNKVVFSTRLGCRYHTGVNICYGARWATDQGLKVSFGDIVMWRKIRHRFQLNEIGLQRSRNAVTSLVEGLVEQVLHRIRRGDYWAAKWLWRLTAAYPSDAYAIKGLARVITKKFWSDGASPPTS